MSQIVSHNPPAAGSLPFFVGRDQELSRIRTWIESHPKGVIIIKGHTDVGKSALLERMARELSEAGYLVGHHRLMVTDEVIRPFFQVLQQIISRFPHILGDEKASTVIKRFLTTEVSWKQLGGVMGALVKDITKGVKLEQTYNKTVEVLSEAASEIKGSTTIEEVMRDHPESVRLTYLLLLQSLSCNLGEEKVILLFDQAEDADVAFWEFLSNLWRAIPGKVFIIFTLNPDKRENYLRLQEKYVGDLTNQSPLFIKLEGLSEQDIGTLINTVTGSCLPQNRLNAIRQKTDGRPLLILSWLNSPQFPDDESTLDIRKYDGFFKQVFEGLDQQAKYIARLLSLLPGACPGGIKMLAKMSEIDVIECNAVIEALEHASICRPNTENPVLIHELMKDWLSRTTRLEVKQAIAQKALRRISEISSENKDLAILWAETALLAHTDLEEAYRSRLAALAEALVQRSELTTAVAMYEALKQKHPKDKVLKISCLRELGSIYKNLGQDKRAMNYLLQGLTVAKEVGNRREEGMVLNNIAKIHMIRGNYGEALSHFDQSLSICKDLGDMEGEGLVLNNIGQVYDAQGKHEEALTSYERGLKIFEEIGNQSGQATSLNNTATIYNAQGQYDEALICFEKSLSFHMNVGDRLEVATVLSNIGLIHHALGDYDQSERFFNQSLVIKKEVGDYYGEATALNNIGLIFFARGNYDGALGYFEKSFALHNDIGSRGSLATVLSNISRVYKKKADYDRALEYLMQSLSISDEQGNLSDKLTAQFNIGMIYMEKNNLNGAIPYIEKAVELEEALNNPNLDNHKELLKQLKLGKRPPIIEQ